MKQRSTTPVASSLATKATLVAASVLMAGAGLLQLGSSALARDYNAEIRAKEQEKAKYDGEAARLGEMAESLQGELDKLSAQVAAIQQDIAASQQKRSDLTSQIEQNQQLIEKNREHLGRILSDMYVDDQISPLEMLASSNSIGDYIDKQEQRSSLRAALNDKIKDIKALQQKLKDDKKAVERVIHDQELQQQQLNAKQAEQAKLVADTKHDQAAYQQLAQTRNREIASLREQQAAANRRASGNISIPAGVPGGGGYPGKWANAPLDAYVDPWGLYTRECVSYAAWKVYSTGRYVPHFGGRGNAKEWPSTVARHGIQSGSTPKAGSVAMLPVGYYGHVMYVESVNGDGTITVSDYNLAWDGLYRIYTRSAAGLTYIYF